MIHGNKAEIAGFDGNEEKSMKREYREFLDFARRTGIDIVERNERTFRQWPVGGARTTTIGRRLSTLLCCRCWLPDQRSPTQTFALHRQTLEYSPWELHARTDS